MKVLITFVLVAVFSVTGFGQQSVGTVAQDFAQLNMLGESVELSNLKGKVVILTFWSTKCQICVSEMPKLNNLVDKYDGREVEFLALTMNQQDIVENFLKKKTFKFNILPNSFGVVLKYADRDRAGRLNMGFPAHFVVNQDGKVVLKTSGFKQSDKLDSVISGLLGS